MANEKEPKGQQPSSPEIVPMEQYKNLQRQMESLRQRHKEAVVQRLDVDEIKSDIKTLTDLMAVVVEGSGMVEAEDTAPKVKRIKSDQELLKKGTHARRELQSLLVDNDLEWSDPQLEKVRKLYEEEKYDDAVQEAKRQLNTESSGKGDIDALVEAEVQKRLKGSVKVDRGDSVAVGGIPTDPAQLRSRLTDKSFVRENRKALLEAARKGLIK